jgi:hypothetical protein
MQAPRNPRLLLLLLSCSLLLVLAACSPQPQLAVGGLSISNQVSTVAMSATSTTCPADGTARPAIMAPLALGSHRDIVYVYNEIPPNTSTAYGHIKRYDVVTGQKTSIVTSGLSIQHAQLSSDGQWVLFLSQVDPRGDRNHSSMLQLVRMDGQGLQTLYCLPSSVTSASVQWSTDQKTVLISTDANNSISTVTLLTLATGGLQTELHITDTNYAYTVLTWINTTRAYVEKTGRSGPQPPITLYLLDTRSRALTQVLQHSVRFSYLSLDSSNDGNKLFVSYCFNQTGFDTTISVGPAAGGTQRTIYHQTNICAQTLRAVTSTTLLIVGQRYDSAHSTFFNQAWKMKPDGSGRTVLFDTASNGITYSLNVFTQFPWSNISRDGSLYSLQTTTNNGSRQQTLDYASLNGGAPIQFAYTSTGSVDIVGWTTM